MSSAKQLKEQEAEEAIARDVAEKQAYNALKRSRPANKEGAK